MSLSAIQVKNWQKTVGIEEKLDIISRLTKGEQIVDICCNVGLILAHVQFVIMLIELKKVLSQELKCLLARLPQPYWNEPYQQLLM
jgi:hypothetical protein